MLSARFLEERYHNTRPYNAVDRWLPTFIQRAVRRTELTENDIYSGAYVLRNLITHEYVRGNEVRGRRGKLRGRRIQAWQWRLWR